MKSLLMMGAAIKNRRLLLFLGLALWGLTSCTIPYPPTPFLSQVRPLAEGSFFKGEEVLAPRSVLLYHKVFLYPVKLDFAEAETLYNIPSLDLQRLGRALNAKLRGKLPARFAVLDSTSKIDPQTLILEPALIALKRPNPALNLIPFVPLSFGSAVIQIKIMDGRTGQTLLEISEKRWGSWSPKSFFMGPFMKYQPVEAIFSKWADRLLDRLSE